VVGGGLGGGGRGPGFFCGVLWGGGVGVGWGLVAGGGGGGWGVVCLGVGWGGGGAPHHHKKHPPPGGFGFFGWGALSLPFSHSL